MSGRPMWCPPCRTLAQQTGPGRYVCQLCGTPYPEAKPPKIYAERTSRRSRSKH